MTRDEMIQRLTDSVSDLGDGYETSHARTIIELVIAALKDDQYTTAILQDLVTCRRHVSELLDWKQKAESSIAELNRTIADMEAQNKNIKDSGAEPTSPRAARRLIADLKDQIRYLTPPYKEFQSAVRQERERSRKLHQVFEGIAAIVKAAEQELL